ncbi:MAG TPA: PAS domain S-box protein [Candidatus Saccharimonadales bacterium]|nr:PAS domain S-box protein [Candidatus Saccharimonadales bacterium]
MLNYLRQLEAKVVGRSRRLWWYGYAVAVILVCLAVAMRLTWRELFNPSPYLLFLLVVFMTSWLGSLKASLVATAALVAAQIYYFTPPLYSFSLAKAKAADWAGLVGFLAVSLITSLLVWARNAARLRADVAVSEAQDSAQRTEAILRSALDSIIVMDHAGKVVEFNPAAEHMFGYTQAQAIGQEMAQLIIPERYRDRHRQGLARYLETGQGPLLGRRIEITALRAGGSEFEVELAITPIRVAGQPLFTGYLRDITERKQLDRQKDDFISMASHELKTPVTSVKLYAQSLQRRLRKLGDEPAVASLGRVTSQLDRLTMLINALLDLSRVETGKLILNLEDINLNEVIEVVVSQVAIVSPDHQISVQGRLPQLIYADKVRLGQAISNLITNAVKYTPGGGQVLVAVEPAAAAVTIRVVDQGVGIATHQQAKIFERYHRVYKQDGKIFSGLGIGLYITAEIIKLHHGKIGVESKEGKGSTFYITLPLKVKEKVEETNTSH